MPTIRAPRALPPVTIGGGVTLVPTAVTVLPATASIVEAETEQLTATVTNANGETLTVSKAAGATVFSTIAVTWASDDEGVATVSAAGLVTAVAAGDCYPK